MFEIRRLERSGSQITDKLYNLGNGIMLYKKSISHVEQAIFEVLNDVENVGRLIAFVEDKNTEIRRRKKGWLIAFNWDVAEVTQASEPVADTQIRDLWDQILELLQKIHKKNVSFNDFSIADLFQENNTAKLLVVNLAGASQQVPIDILDEIYFVANRLKRIEAYSERRIFLAGSKVAQLLNNIESIKQKKPKINEIDKLNKLIRKIWKDV